MLSFLRSSVPRTNTASQNPIHYEDGRSWQKFYAPTDEYLTTHYVPPSTTPSFFNPPAHFHLKQVETFHVESGHGNWYLPRRQIGPTVAGPGEKVVIPMGSIHRFENASSTEPLVVHFKLDTARRDAEECFFRNFFGYLDDCRKAGKEPSLLQLLIFLNTVDGPIALEIPGPEWLSRWVSWLFMLVLGVGVGGMLLGYQSSYPEYYRSRKQTD